MRRIGMVIVLVGAGLGLGFSDTGSPRGATDVKQWVYFLRPVRPGFAKGLTEQESQTMAQHARYLRDLTKKGTVILAGPCLDRSAGIVIFEAPDEASAVAIARNDPAAKAGVMGVTVKPFRVAMARGS